MRKYYSESRDYYPTNLGKVKLPLFENPKVLQAEYVVELGGLKP